MGSSSSSSSRRSAGSSASSSSSSSSSASYRQYRVQKGDTLGYIACRYLGNSKRYMEIYRLNSNTIRNPDLIITGQVISLPHGGSSQSHSACARWVSRSSGYVSPYKGRDLRGSSSSSSSSSRGSGSAASSSSRRTSSTNWSRSSSSSSRTSSASRGSAYSSSGSSSSRRSSKSDN